MKAWMSGCMVVGALWATGMMTNALAEGAQGRVTKNGQIWTVADVYAWRNDQSIEVVFTSQPLDRTAIAKDGRVDSLDFVGIGGHKLTITIERDGPAMCFHFGGGGGGGSSCNSDFPAAVRITANDGKRIAGSVDWSEGEDTALELAFDLPVVTEVQRPGRPLPADGGEPGKAVLAHFAAMASGDLAKIKAISRPEQVAMIEAESEGDLKEMLEFMQAMTPTEVRITGGAIDGDSALVDYTGSRDGAQVTGTAELERVAGRWYVTGTSTRN